MPRHVNLAVERLGLVCQAAWQMKTQFSALLLFALLGVARAEPEQFIVLNLSGGATAAVFEQIGKEFNPARDLRVHVGVAAFFSYLHQPRAKTVEDLRHFLRLSREKDMPVVVQLDGESWWGARPDLWNWWDATQPGCSSSNQLNVEWTDWSPEAATKIAWRNWGRQIRVLPPPNLMSPSYRKACHEEMAVLVPIVVEWWKELPPEKKYLFIGLKVGWESSIGVNAWYYPNGNALLDRPASEDPTTGLNATELPSRGVAQIGYAALKTSGIRSEGKITEADLAEVARRHLDDLSREAARLGLPRDKLFTHGAGWKDGEALYGAAINRFSCPGWSFYRHAADPSRDLGVQQGLKRSDAPYWAAVEWLYDGPREVEPWRQALEATLGQPRCRYLCIYNWEGIRESKEVLQAIRTVLAAKSSRPAR